MFVGAEVGGAEDGGQGTEFAGGGGWNVVGEGWIGLHGRTKGGGEMWQDWGIEVG